MEERRLISIVDPEGNVSTVEYVTDFEIDGNSYLVYDKFEEVDEDIDCYIVKLLSHEGGYMIDEIKDDAEYLKVSKKVDELILGVGEQYE